MRSTRIRSLSIAVALAAIALLATAVSAAAAPKAVKGGELDWGVKESFDQYVTEFAMEGSIETGGGASEASHWVYAFPVVSGSYDEATETNEVQYVGSVHYVAYGGLLDITIKNPKLVLEGTEGALFADVVSGGSETAGLELVELDATGVTPVAEAETLSWEGIESALTEDGVPVFQSYPEGEEFDPVDFTDSWVPTAKEESTTPPPSGGDPGTVTPPAAESPAPPAAVIASPKVTLGKATRQLNGSGWAEVATLSCPAGGGACKTTAPKRLAAEIDGKRYVLTVVAPKSIAAGKSAAVKVLLPKAARLALGADKLAVKFQVSLQANGQTAKQMVDVKIAGRH